MAKLEYEMTRDILFKILFVQNEDLLKNLVSKILGITVEDMKEFKVTNPEITPESLSGKFCVLDIKMEINGQVVNLEVQVKDEDDFPERSLFYWSRSYTKELKKGGDYIDLRKTIGIHIVKFDMCKDTKDFHSEFRALEVSRHTELTDKMVLHYFELKKLPEVTKADAENVLKLWLGLFKAETEEEMAKIVEIGGKVMEQAVMAYKSVVASDTFQEAEYLRRINETAALRHARNQGKAEGKAEGVIQTARNMKDLGIDTNTIAKATKLTVDEILKL